MPEALNLKPNIYKLVVKQVIGDYRDYAVEAYSTDTAVQALSKKLKIPLNSIRIDEQGYFGKELVECFKNPFIRAYQTLSKEDYTVQKRKEIAQANLRNLLRPERSKRFSDCNMYVHKIEGDETPPELQLRFFYGTIGRTKKGFPIFYKNNRDYLTTGSKRFYKEDLNDAVVANFNTLFLPNTDYVFPYLVNGRTDDEAISSVFRFPSLRHSYEKVRSEIVESGISDVPYINNKTLTYLEMCDSLLSNSDWITPAISKIYEELEYWRFDTRIYPNNEKSFLANCLTCIIGEGADNLKQLLSESYLAELSVNVTSNRMNYLEAFLLLAKRASVESVAAFHFDTTFKGDTTQFVTSFTGDTGVNILEKKYPKNSILTIAENVEKLLGKNTKAKKELKEAVSRCNFLTRPFKTNKDISYKEVFEEITKLLTMPCVCRSIVTSQRREE